MKTRRRNLGQMQQLYRDYQQSNQTLNEFARQRNLSRSTLVYWFYRRLREPEQALPDAAQFVEVKLPPSKQTAPVHYRIDLPGGAGLSFTGPVCPEDLRQLIDLLGSSSQC